MWVFKRAHEAGKPEWWCIYEGMEVDLFKIHYMYEILKQTERLFKPVYFNKIIILELELC